VGYEKMFEIFSLRGTGFAMMKKHGNVQKKFEILDDLVNS
jgi:hypothetical protein